MFRNEETGQVLNITDAGSASWVENTLQYSSGGNYYYICPLDMFCDKDYLSSWEGIFVKGLRNNITLLRQD